MANLPGVSEGVVGAAGPDGQVGVGPLRGGSADGPACARWLVAAAYALGAAREEIDALNVFPIPDGDTGTNLALTAAAVGDAVVDAVALTATDAAGDGPATAAAAAKPPAAGEVLAVAATASLLAARGNSGVIFSAWMRGFAAAARDETALDGRRLAAALAEAAAGARGAVAEPLEGTILSVADAAASAAAAATVAASPGAAVAADVSVADPPAADTPAADAAASSAPTDADGRCAAVAAAALAGARDALARTPEQLPALAAAGVVDAGGRGLVVVLEALLGAPSAAQHPPLHPPGSPSVAADPSRGAAGTPAAGSPAYEVLYLLEAPESALPALRAVLQPLGDSLVVSGAEGRWRVHVHVDDVGAAIEAGIEAGRPRDISVTRFADELAAAPAHGPGTAPARTGAGRAVVAVAPGHGLGSLLAEEGATVLDGRDTSPSTADVLAAIRRTGAAEVIVLPNDPDIRPVAEAAAELARADGCAVAVVPTRSSMQGLAAIAVHDADRPFGADVIAMTAAARSTRSAEVTVATRQALTSAGVCEAGSVLGLIEHDVVLIADDVEAAARELLERLLRGGGELVTLITGADAPPGLGERLSEHLRLTCPAVEVALIAGEQPLYPLLVGVE